MLGRNISSSLRKKRERQKKKHIKNTHETIRSINFGSELSQQELGNA